MSTLPAANGLINRIFQWRNNVRLPMRELDKLINTRGSTGGLIKRIDENRELLQTLQMKAPQLLEKCPWIIGWISANDSFFVQLDQLLLAKGRQTNFPRTLGGFND